MIAKNPRLLFCLFAALTLNQSSSRDVAYAEQPEKSKGTNWIPLFDGKSLDGWTIENDCRAEVRDGNLVLASGNGWLRSDHTYRDFRLHVEWKALQSEKYDAGIYVRTLPGGKPFPKRGYQINLLKGKEGNTGRVKGATSRGLIKPAGQWNVFDVKVVGRSISLEINGKAAYKVDGLDIDRGYIGLQIEVPSGGQFLVRDIRIVELGYRNLFNGRDLTGWEGAGQPAETCWEVANGILQCTGKKGPWLRSTEEFGDFNLRFDYQVPPGGNSGVYVRVPADGKHHRDAKDQSPAGFEVQILDDAATKYSKLKDYQYCGSIYAVAASTKHVCKPAGQWNSMEINCTGDHVTINHNGIVIVDAKGNELEKLKLRKLKGFLGFQNHSSVVKFRRIRISSGSKKRSGRD